MRKVAKAESLRTPRPMRWALRYPPPFLARLLDLLERGHVLLYEELPQILVQAGIDEHCLPSLAFLKAPLRHR